MNSRGNSRLNTRQGSRLKLTRTPTQEDLMNTKAEVDKLRRLLMDKKQQITNLEKEASKLDELQILMRDMIYNFRRQKKIQFFDIDPEQDIPLRSPNQYIKIIKDKISALLATHMRLSSKFEVELKKQQFEQEQKIKGAQQLLENEKKALADALADNKHQKRMIRMVVGQKLVLQRTIIMAQDAVDRHQQIREENQQTYEQKLQNKLQSIQTMKEKFHKETQENTMKLKKMRQKNQEMIQKKEYHQQLIDQKEKLQAEFQKISYDQSCLMADLDRAKEELDLIHRKNDSYMANLKTHELLDAERENDRLRHLLKNEKKRSQSALDIQLSKTKQLEDHLQRIIEETTNINATIADNEAKLQALTMRIPDFNQLQQALDRVISNARKNKEDVLQTQYMLDEIRDKNRLLEQQEYNESKIRTEQLKQRIGDPLFED
ncbi:hypothetical protein TVAG_129950 [Trichomonas vaginalis G3]|uniref:Uncharacterized protein n=1 Tax=Trichomonas vaginalis (strain ATCC PRA-98 / G3) TaxID=412133 RepID=A2DI91_TRIV3|nr:hypothetical protein TVAGG3_0712200 [Trichomonas vaginalis G3]EAY19887.1 hypothetical protein TVAG_129950 [Trichomonas vaginalis G3]KAI5509986.1 hypothetical protein TVAGG3_0712200 [Trichomonas vaginalis G3]|eukprot:XP_001580873.1 hypothetical protein [Trichomonas vaginalis G3]